MDAEISVTKLDAARRQLETAVRLYFSNNDPVSIHTLTEAAYELLMTTNRKRGGQKMVLKEQFPEAVEKVRPDKVKEVLAKLNEAKNFFKHGTRDADKALAFKPVFTELLMWEACEKYHELAGESVPALTVFRTWFYLTNGRKFILEGPIREAQKLIPANDPMLSNRPDFFSSMLPLANRLP